MASRRFFVVIECTFLIVIMSSASAQNTWLGAFGGYWGDPGNWSLNHVPTPTENVTIATGQALLNTDSAIESLFLDAQLLTAELGTHQLTIANALTEGANGYLGLDFGSTVSAGADSFNAGSIFLDSLSMLSIAGNLSNSGDIEVLHQASLNVAKNVINSGNIGFPLDLASGGFNMSVAGNLQNLPGATILLYSFFDVAKISGDFNNSGQVFQGLQSNVTVSGRLTNNASGQISIVEGVTQAAKGIVNYGSIFFDFDSFIEAPFLNNGGTIQNSFYTGDTLLIGKGSPVTGGYYQLANGTLGESISSARSFGVIIMGDGAPVVLDGTLSVLLQSGYNPTVGTIFEFLQFSPGELSGSFTHIQNDFFNHGAEKWAVIYDGKDGFVALEAMATPEPSSIALIGVGSVAVGRGLRRRMIRRRLGHPD